MSAPATTAVPLPLEETLTFLPPLPASSKELRSRTRKELLSSPNTPILVALDDDPTGTQTCHDIAVLTSWSVPVLVSEFENTPPGSGFFILTNSRALHPPAARELTIEICRNLKEAAEHAKRSFEVVLRGDSTLRGHFPLEPEAVEEVLGESDAWIIAPFFLQGGRYTIGDIHYVAEGDSLIPAGQTPFAKDATFGFKSSHLADWVVEKSSGSIARDRVKGISLVDIREGGPDRVGEMLIGAAKGTVFIVNAAAEEDIDIVVRGILDASAQGRKLLFRSAAAFVSARLGISPIPPISARQLQLDPAVGGLIIAGSYVPKTTAQLKHLIAQSGDNLTTVELDVNKLLESEATREGELQRALNTAARYIYHPKDVLIMTSRDVIVGADEVSSLDIGSVVAAALVTFLTRLDTKPRYVIAKGGITSSDMATKALGMKRAMIVGQAAAGVPLWRCDEPTSKWPGLPFVVFPGNVGGEDTLGAVVERWRLPTPTNRC
ncbi:Nn.00g070610.m01.CDS01 [Neocucurbitaria sp. VM-36]